MVSLSTVQTSNARISAAIPPTTTPVAVFIGATSGIGRASLLQFAQHTAQNKPRVYFVGRSQAAADEILQQLRRIKPDDGADGGGGGAEYVFIQADVSLLSQVDEVCKQIKEKESVINVLFLSQGTLDMTTETSEKLSLILALSYFSRMRFIANLLPLLQTAGTATMFSRVISVMAGTKEGPINPSDIAGKHVAPWKSRGHMCSMMTLTMEHFADDNNNNDSYNQVSFVHAYPGFVDTGLGRSMKGFVGGAMKAVFTLAKPLLVKHYIPLEECGDRHVFLATSSRYARAGGSSSQSQPAVVEGVETVAAAVGTNGQIGSGVYSVDETGESADARVQTLLEELRQNGVKEKVWQHLQSEFVRITGTSRVD
ncbi:uncharacterized protein TRUGW13939_11225 [Talaromyces rugulosus]|uniref:Ketoreductase (KR) domain-containing protein n=1 Tax=Talaromyces rugulosus TaxID=121627 RepID=A0A7H8RC78_TALRU|nr:uncharacterized protein TRUGW13939_11225 [Talaromyces rugulosus]QKX64052.1 hypothetical protein TRUGW13939_11225 [Talaromyces rugulosus]